MEVSEGDDEMLEIENIKIGYKWKYITLSAKEANGTLALTYAEPYEYIRTNGNTTVAKIRIESGIYNKMGDKDLHDHNIDWEKVNKVVGQTYQVKELLKAKGLDKFNPDDKSWNRGN